MRGTLPIDLTVEQRGQLIAWSRMEPVDSLRSRNSRIILRLADRCQTIEAAREFGLSRQTVSEIRRLFLIFGLNGIERSAPRLGRKPLIRGGKAETILSIGIAEPPMRGCRWTGQQLAQRCELSQPAIYRFLKRHEVSLNDPRTIASALNGFKALHLDIVGLFLSPSISVMAFGCNSGKSTTTFAPTSVVVLQTENLSTFYNRELEGLLKNINEIDDMFLTMTPRRTDYTDVLMFLDILNERTSPHREILLVITSDDYFVIGRVDRWIEMHSRFHLAASGNNGGWIEELQAHFNIINTVDKRAIALQLEHLNSRLTEWRSGPYLSLGVFVSMNTKNLIP